VGEIDGEKVKVGYYERDGSVDTFYDGNTIYIIFLDFIPSFEIYF